MGSVRGRVGMPGPAPLMAQQQEFAQLNAKGGEQHRSLPPCRGEPAYGDTLALWAHGHLQIVAAA